jgi:ubiquinone/menaquinone biosynthesis C-methylase UbiE
MAGVKPPDWAAKKTRQEVLVDQRKFLWHRDTLDKLAAWIGLHPGMHVLDVGCGHGYLGWAYWRYFGKGGSYTGLDASAQLLRHARKESSWADGGPAAFVAGDAARLPFPDDTFHWTVCQTLLMHARNPETFLAEMVRVTRPGGLVTCHEPDNITASRSPVCQSWKENDIEDDLIRIRVQHHWALGRRNLGLGDWGIGCRVPSMMQQLGMKDIGIRANDMVGLLQPPYDTPAMQFRLDQLRRGLEEAGKRSPGSRRADRDFRRCYFAGGGGGYLWRKYLAVLRKSEKENIEGIGRQLSDGTLFLCGGACSFYCITGRKSPV